MTYVLSALRIGIVILGCTSCMLPVSATDSIASVSPTVVQETSPPREQTTLSLVTKRVIGLIPIDQFPELIPLHLPSEIHTNQPITLTVITYGSSSCTTPDGAEVSISDTTLIITPYDVLPVEGTCTADLAEHPRHVEITFPAAGVSTIRIRGQNFQGQVTTFEQTVNVLP